MARTMERQLARPAAATGGSTRTEEEMQVLDVQRQEGVRLAFEVLAWATGTRRSLAAFQVGLSQQAEVMLTGVLG